MIYRGIRSFLVSTASVVFLVAGLWATEDIPVPAATDNPPASVDQKKPAWKLMADDSIALEIRGGTIIWSGLVMPAYDPANPTGINGINAANFLYPSFPVLGVGTRISLGPIIRIAPSLDLLVDEYLYRPDYDRAFRTTPETGVAVVNGATLATVIGFLVSVPLWFDLALSDRLVLSLAPGVAFYPRIAVEPLDNSTGIEKITENLNREGKWLYPETGIGLSYALGPWFAAGLQIQVMYPLYHAWSTDGLAFHDGMMVTGSLGFDLFF